MKMQQMGAIRRRSFRKYRDVFLPVQNFGNLLIDDPCMPTATPAQEDSIVSGRQPANQRPMTDFLLGDEGGRQHAVDYINIDPGNVIGYQQCTRHGMGQIRLNLDPESFKQRTGPTGFETQTKSVTANRENTEHEKSPAENQQGQAQ